MFHALGYPFSGSDMVSDLIYVGYVAFMWSILGLARHFDNRLSLRQRATRRSSLSS